MTGWGASSLCAVKSPRWRALGRTPHPTPWPSPACRAQIRSLKMETPPPCPQPNWALSPRARPSHSTFVTGIGHRLEGGQRSICRGVPQTGCCLRRTTPPPGGWVVRGPKKVCVPKIGLTFPAPLINFSFGLRKIFLMWVGGSVGQPGLARAPNTHTPGVLKQWPDPKAWGFQASRKRK